MRKDKKPEIEQIEKSLLYLKKVNDPLRQIQKEHEEFYWNTYSLKFNATARFSYEIRRPRAMRFIGDAATNIAMDKLTVNVPPRLKGKKLVVTKEEQERVDHVGTWLQNLLDINSHFRPYFLYEAALFGGLRGEAYFQLKYTPLTQLPLRITAPDPFGIFASMDSDVKGRPLMLFQEKIQTVSYIRDLIEEWTGKDNLMILPNAEEHELAYWVEWWTPQWRGILSAKKATVDTLLAAAPPLSSAIYDALPMTSTMEIITPNPYGWVPFFRGYSGRGYQSADGEPSKIAVGLLRGIEASIIQESRELTKADTVSSLYAVPPIRIEHDGTYKEDDLQLPTDPGVIVIDIIGHKKTEYMQLPPVSPAVLQVLSQVQADFEAVYPAVIRGVAQPGEPAMSLISRRSQAMKQWMPLAENLYEMLVNTLASCLEVAEQLSEEPIVLNGKSLSPKDVDGYYEVSLDRKSTDPEDERIRMAMGRDMYEFFPDEDHAEIFLGQKNPTDFVTRRAVSKFLNKQLDTEGSALQQLLINRFMKQAGMQEELAALKNQAQATKETGLRTPKPGVGPLPVGNSPTRGVIGQPPEEGGPGVEQLEELERVLGGQ